LIPRENGGSSEFEKVLSRTNEQVKLTERGIKRQEFEQIVGQLATTKHENVSTRFGKSYRILSENTNAYGNGYAAIYYRWTHDETIERIWLINPFRLQECGISDTLKKIGRTWNLILIDWNSEELVDLFDEIEISNYLT
ncbi:MAG: hypothetical protein MI810_15330, partial [Flavobacteriales bacterium]|nr:hypothetical protein [Flavobacteriales bacterium]